MDRGLGNHRGYAANRDQQYQNILSEIRGCEGKKWPRERDSVEHWEKQWLWIEGYSQPQSRYPLFLTTPPSSAGVLCWKPQAKRFLLRQSLRSGSLGRGQGIEGWTMDLKNNWDLLNIFPLPHIFFFPGA